MIVLLCERAKCDAKRRTALASKHAPTRAGAQLCVLKALTWTGDTLARTYELLVASTGGEIDVTGAITRLTQRRALALIDQRKMRFARGA